MIYLVFALFLFFIWWLSDKYYKDRFFPYLKWSSIIFIAIIALVDVFMFIETERMLAVWEAAGSGDGLYYGEFSNVTNTTQYTYMYRWDGADTATVMMFHEIDYGMFPVITGLLPLLMIFIVFALLLQIFKTMYDENINGKRIDSKKKIGIYGDKDGEGIGR